MRYHMSCLADPGTTFRASQRMLGKRLPSDVLSGLVI